jgi:hypothetical protein
VSVGKVDTRKGQSVLQSILPQHEVSFIGPEGNSQQFDFSSSQYLGPWNKSQLYENLTQFGNLVHLATNEGAPLVILEALSAGLGVVTTLNASANLDNSLPFITVIPDEKMFDAEYVLAAIRQNREISLSMREEIREYARKSFSWSEVVVPIYATLIENLLRQKEVRVSSWVSKYTTLYPEQVAAAPYLAVISMLPQYSDRIITWIEKLRSQGVGFFLLYCVDSDQGVQLKAMLASYVKAGIVEIQLLSDFAFYHTMAAESRIHALENSYFQMLVLNEAVAYLKLLGITWHTVLFEQDYLFSQLTAMDGVKTHLSQLEQQGIDILVVHGSVIEKVDKSISLFEDKRFIVEDASRSIVQTERVFYHGILDLTCSAGKRCNGAEVYGNFNSIHSEIAFTAANIEYVFDLEKNDIIESKDREISLLVDELVKKIFTNIE